MISLAEGRSLMTVTALRLINFSTQTEKIKREMPQTGAFPFFGNILFFANKYSIDIFFNKITAMSEIHFSISEKANAFS